MCFPRQDFPPLPPSRFSLYGGDPVYHTDYSQQVQAFLFVESFVISIQH